MNPIEIFYCWQALVHALMVYMLTQLVKTAITKQLGPWCNKKPNRTWWVKRVILPAVPPILGFLGAASIPLRPDVLIEYVNTHSIPAHQASLVYGAWGAAVGQFADYIYSKFSAAMKDREIST